MKHYQERLAAGLCISRLIEAQAARTPDAIAIVAPGRRPLTYSRLITHIEDTVATVNAMGFGRHDRIAIVLPNGPEMAVGFLAVAAGTGTAPLNPAFTAREFGFYLSDSKVNALIVQSGIDSPARAIGRALGIRIIELSPALEEEAGIFTLAGDADSPVADGGFAQGGDVALVLHTSGTTSRPKIVPLTQTNICAAVVNSPVTRDLVESDRCLNVQPLFHAGGLLSGLLTSLLAGASFICTPGFDAPKFFEWIECFRPTWYLASPTVHRAILARAARHREVITRCPLRFVRSGASPLSPRLMAELEDVFGAPVRESYGMTETAGRITYTPLPPHQRKPGSVGVAAGPELAIMDEPGNLLAAGETGEIVVRGANVFQGYEGDSEETQRAFVDGWFRTGDQGYLDTDGYLFITGRLKEIINRGGEKISPREVDEVLMAHPAVAEAVAFPVPDARLGEDIFAAIVLRENTSATGSEILEFAAARLAGFKLPRRVLVVDEMPKGSTSKPQRANLAEKLGLTTGDKASPEARSGDTALRTCAAQARRKMPLRFVDNLFHAVLRTRRERPGLAKAIEAPGDTLEAQLLEIWEKVLDIHPIGVKDDFFELGGHSLLAVRLFAEMEKAFGKKLPLSLLIEGGTIEHMAGIFRQEGCSAPWSSLLAIQPQGCKPPFFCVHGLGGTALLYRDLARRLGQDQPVYGIQARGLDGRQPPLARIEDMAGHYISTILTVQPQGPYYLGGLSFGGMVAFEMAQQLRARGHLVALLALFDAGCPNYTRSWPASRRIRRHVENVLALDPRGKLDYVLERVGSLKDIVAGRVHMVVNGCDPDVGRPLPRALLDARVASRIAMDRYMPHAYPGRVVLFLARHNPQSSYRHDPRLAWRKLATGKWEVEDVPGSHVGMLTEPHVRVLAEKLQACLLRAQTDAPGEQASAHAVAP